MMERKPGRLLASVEYAAVNGARLVIVDYLQCFANQERETDKHFLSIKHLSAQLRAQLLRHSETGKMLHVMALSSLNRSEASSGRPGLASLFGSSGLSHDCTESIMIYSENSEDARMKEALTGQRPVIVEIVKARNGQRGPVGFTFFGEPQRFEEQNAREIFAGFTLEIPGGSGHGN
jgi:replicative DNA helicase